MQGRQYSTAAILQSAPTPLPAHFTTSPLPLPDPLPRPLPCLQGYLAALGDSAVTEQLLRRFKEATNMTDEISALAALDRAGGRWGLMGAGLMGA